MKATALLIFAIGCGTTPLEPFVDRLSPGNIECRQLESEVIAPSDPIDRIQQLRNQELFSRKCVTKGAGDETQKPAVEDDDPSR